MSTADPIVGEKAFAFALFEQTMSSLEGVTDRDRDLRDSRSLFDIGKVREERVILAEGAAVGVFDRDTVARRLAEQDTVLTRINADQLARYGDKLPVDLSTEQLLAEDISAVSPAEFLWTLSFRQYETKHAVRYQRPLQQTILFATDSEWEQLLQVAARSVASILEHGFALSEVLTDTFEAVRLCSRLLEHHVGVPFGTADPWGLNADGWRFERVDVHFSRLSKEDARAPEAVREAANALATSDSSDKEQRYTAGAVINDYFLVRLLSVVRQPQTMVYDTADPEELPHLRSRIIEAVSAAEGFAAAQALGPSSSWALSLWRLAPSDSQSQSRMTAVIAQMGDLLSRLRHAGQMRIGQPKQ